MVLSPGSIRAAWAALPIEIAVGTIMFAHGLTKLTNPAEFAANAMGGISLFLAYLVVAAEFGGGLLLLMGLLVRLGAFGHFCVMAVAVTQVHWSAGLTGRSGFEFPLALLAASIALLIIGADPLSIDQNLKPSIYSSREAAFRRESTDVGGLMVKAASAVLILAGIALPFARQYLGIPDGLAPLVITIAFGLASVASGGALVIGKPWAYIPAFVLARLYLAASVLLLFWIKYTVRGVIAVALSLAMLAALQSARRSPG